MVKIRLSLKGAKKRPFYQIIVTDSRNSRDGRFIEKLGFFNPIESNINKSIKINLDRVNYWISNGAKKSERVNYLIKKFIKQNDYKK